MRGLKIVTGSENHAGVERWCSQHGRSHSFDRKLYRFAKDKTEGNRDEQWEVRRSVVPGKPSNAGGGKDF
jgi:hypothetical protein